MPQLPGQLMHDLFEDHVVHILSQHVEQKPISHLTLLDDGVDDIFLDESEPNEEQIGPHLGTDDDDHSVDDHEGRQTPQNQEPEPQEDVDLLVDNIERQDAEGVMLFHFARGTELVKRAFGHTGKHVDHGIQSILLIAFGERNHLQTES